MGVLEDFIGYTNKQKISNITLNISQPYLITKITQGFNKYMNQFWLSITQLQNIRGLYLIKIQT